MVGAVSVYSSSHPESQNDVKAPRLRVVAALNTQHCLIANAMSSLIPYIHPVDEESLFS